MSDGLAELLEIKSDSVKLARGRSCKKDEYEWIPRAELDKMISSGEVNQITETKNSDNQLEQDNSKNNPMTYAKRIDHCNFMNIEKIRSIQVNTLLKLAPSFRTTCLVESTIGGSWIDCWTEGGYGEENPANDQYIHHNAFEGNGPCI